MPVLSAKWVATVNGHRIYRKTHKVKGELVTYYTVDEARKRYPSKRRAINAARNRKR